MKNYVSIIKLVLFGLSLPWLFFKMILIARQEGKPQKYILWADPVNSTIKKEP